MREICTSGSMSGEEKRSDGPLGERSHERRRALLASPVLHATALLLDSTDQVVRWVPYRRNGLQIRSNARNDDVAIAHAPSSTTGCIFETIRRDFVNRS